MYQLTSPWCRRK